MTGSATFGERIRQLMDDHKLSMRRLATIVPCNAGHLSRVINGLKSPSEQMVKRLDEVLGAKGELIALAPQRSRATGCEACRPTASPQAAEDQPAANALAGHHGRPLSEAAASEPLLPTHGTAEGDLISAIAGATRAHAELAEVTEVGPGTLEQLRVDVVDMARAYVFTAPLPLFLEMNRVRGRIFDALGRKSHPAQERELYLLAGSSAP